MITPQSPQGRVRAVSLRGRRGFSLAEVITVLAVVGILAGISVLRLNPAKDAAKTAAVTSDLRTIALAAQSYQMDHGKWPRSGGDGTTPADLVNYLPGGFSFRGPDYSYEYRNVEVDGQPPAVSIMVRTRNPTLQDRLMASLGGRDGFVASGGFLSYVLSGSIQMGVPESGTIAAPPE
jgi:prepilin-type N-terminal cleavage/methylation domain-containing protein